MSTPEVSVAFVMADLSGFTALTEAHGAREAAALVGRYVELARAALAPGARLVERIGDELLIAADAPPAALRTALALAAALEREPRFPMARIGLHAGPVIEQDGAFFGAALNLTARVADHARAGQILCTSAIAAGASPLEGVAFRPLGGVKFRNVPDPVDVFEVVAEAFGEREAWIDPVCQMRVEPGTAAGRLTWAGRAWYFCSLECARAFAERPDRYVATGSSPSA